MDIFEIYYSKGNLHIKDGMEAYMRNQFKFLGIKTPERRALSKEFIQDKKADKNIDWDFIFRAYGKEEREFKYLAIDYLKACQKNLQVEEIDYLKELVLLEPWWDTVDLLSKLIGSLLLKDGSLKESHILKWAQDESIWLRRVAILHQLGFKDKMDKDLLSQIIRVNLGSGEFFIDKAIGWILRDYSKTDPDFVIKFIKSENRLANLSRNEGLKYLKEQGYDL